MGAFSILRGPVTALLQARWFDIRSSIVQHYAAEIWPERVDVNTGPLTCKTIDTPTPKPRPSTIIKSIVPKSVHGTAYTSTDNKRWAIVNS